MWEVHIKMKRISQDTRSCTCNLTTARLFLGCCLPLPGQNLIWHLQLEGFKFENGIYNELGSNQVFFFSEITLSKIFSSYLMSSFILRMDIITEECVNGTGKSFSSTFFYTSMKVNISNCCTH